MWRIINWRKSTAGEYAEARRETEVRYPGIPEKAFHMEQRRKRKRNAEHFNTFISDSTLHGLHFCFDKKHLARRIIWTLILISAFGYVGEKIYASLLQFFQYPMSTTTTLVYDEPPIKLPAISICNTNDFKRSVVVTTKLGDILRNKTENITGSEYSSLIKLGNHRLVDMLVRCRQSRKLCSVSDFVEYWDNSGTVRCHTFNSGKTGPIMSINRTGTNEAIEMVINIQQYDYNDFDTAGIKLIIHGQDQTPIKTAGLLLAPGTVTNIEISKRKRVNLKHPYKTNCGSLKLKAFESYSEHLCWLDQLTSYVVEKCGCVDAFMPGKHKVCDFKTVGCVWNNWESFDIEQKYQCPIPCVVEEFIAKQSSAMFPSNAAADNLAIQLNLTGTAMENRLFIRENFLKFKVFFGEYSYELVEQVPSYDLKVLLGDIGGQLGLFLGSSLLTYVEFFDCLLMIIYTKFFEVLLPR